jgi:hypothetical protein
LSTAAIGFVIDTAQHVERLDDPAEFLQRPREARRSVMGLEGSHQTAVDPRTYILPFVYGLFGGLVAVAFQKLVKQLRGYR